MKTIEDKARAYDEAIKKAAALYKASEPMSGCNVIIETLFPELAESEDEKIRREIINYFKCQTRDEPSRKDIHNKWISWLERQGEHANFRNKIQVGDKVTRNEAGVLVNLSQLKRVAKPSEEQGKQKPVIEFKTAAESLGISSDEYNKIVDECLFGEQKLTEFERGLFDMLTDISKPCTADCVKSHSKKLLSIARKMIALEQEPAEWSEEDERRLNTIIHNVTIDKSMCKYEVAKSICDEQINWLKSIKDRVQPQNRWKPTDEQMGCLSDAIEHYNSLGYPAPKLKELYEQLKKL